MPDAIVSKSKKSIVSLKEGKMIISLSGFGVNRILETWMIEGVTGSVKGLAFYTEFAKAIERQELTIGELAKKFHDTLDSHGRDSRVPADMLIILSGEFDTMVLALAGERASDRARQELRALNRKDFEMIIAQNSNLMRKET